jgi:chromosome segregation protein
VQIKRLKLTGFKSFVEPAELRIEPGLTGVVGPNGCGKSNLLEAIRWAVGEVSPKSLRGAGMDDVIFAGTSVRPARDYAEVSLLLLEHGSGEEAEVTRRIERGAGSAYRLDGRDVRAKDIALLFADAATGAHSPALVSQGRISAVIAARPTERRQMLEEAAGVAGLHVRRKDAERKLRATEANLDWLGELLAGMEERTAALRRQVRAAERYRLQSDRIRTAEARLIFARWRAAAAEAHAATEEAERATAAVEQAGTAQRTAAARQAEAGRTLTKERAAAQHARDAAAALGHQQAGLAAELIAAKSRIAEQGERLVSLAADRKREAALAADAAAATVSLDGELAAIAGRLADAEEKQAALDTRLGLARASAAAAEEQSAAAQGALAAQHAEARFARATLESARSRDRRASADAARLDAQLAELGDEAPLIAARLAANQRKAEAEEKLEGARGSVETAEQERKAAGAARDLAQVELAAARAEVAALQSEAQALLRTVETGSGDRAIDRIKAEPGYERALAAALGDDLLASLGGGGSRWTGSHASSADPALAEQLQPLVAHVDAPAALHRRLAQVGVADADDGTIALMVGQRLVTRDGRLRRWDGFVAEGSGAAAAERLIRLARLAQIEQALPIAATRREGAEAAGGAALRAMESARTAAEMARKDEAGALDALRAAEREEDQAVLALERLEMHRAMLAEQAIRAAADRKAAEQLLAEAEAVVAALPDALDAEALVAARRSSAALSQSELAGAQAEAAAIARELAADKARAATALTERDGWVTRAATAERRLLELDGRIEEAAAQQKALAGEPERIAAEIAQLSCQVATTKAARATSSAAEAAAEAELKQVEAALATAAEALAEARELRAGAAARADNQQSRRVEMGRIAGERFQCPPPLLPQTAGFDPASVGGAADESVEHDRLVRDRERMGPVNLLAGHELTELVEQHAASQAQHAELLLSIQRLRGSIGNLNREGRARLLAAFEAVDRHFQTLFKSLFEGGEAHLALVESDDPLEAGLEIMAQPPGKRLSALTLLSGGEQALTAIALIFALFLTNPAPICVLDEVDAPLDDANVERFCDLLDRMSEGTDTRYLIVTHNAVTMSRLHRLYGVTMIERGVSRLVSVDLGGANRLLAAE